jgi:hypothetical protein
MAKVVAAALLFGFLGLALGAGDAVAAEKKTAVVMCSALGAGLMTVIACGGSAGLTTTCPASQAGNTCAQTLADFMNTDKLRISNVVGDGDRLIYTLTR